MPRKPPPTPRLIDNGDMPTRGVALVQIHHHGREGWLLEAPLREGRSARARIDDFDTLAEAVGVAELAALAFNGELSAQRQEVQAPTND